MALEQRNEQLAWLLDEIDEAIGGAVSNLARDEAKASDLQNGMADGFARVAWHFGLAAHDDMASYLVALRAGNAEDASALRKKILDGTAEGGAALAHD